jgi:hypothetical protein
MRRKEHGVMPNIVVVGPGVRSKRRPRGRPFKKGERQPFQYQPGQSGNPGGKPKIHQTLSMEYSRWLARPVPSQVAATLGLPPGSTCADAIAAAMCIRAVSGDVNAARELCDRTEGRVSASVSVEGKIDYAAGQSAKEELLKKLAAFKD